jgi:L-ascorbate metabolism protein UlaG (beta-lactamase superfamily)
MKTRVQWLGHSCVLVESSRYRLLIDPFFTHNPTAPIKATEVKPDYILVTHGHDDHIGDTVEIAKRTGAKVITIFEIGNWLEEKQGLKDVHGMQLGGGFNFPFGRVKLTLALHGSALPDGSNGGNPCGFYFTFNDGKRVYHAGDTGLFGDMKLIGEEGIDLAFLPIGDNYTMGPDDAVRAIKLLTPKQVVPIHYDTFDLIKQDALAWAEQVRRETMTVPVVMKPGEWLEV